MLFSRLQDLGLRGVESLVLMRTRNTMVSLIGRTLRVNEAYADAPESVLRAIVVFALARTKAERAAARDEILKFEGDRPAVPRRVETPRPGDLALLGPNSRRRIGSSTPSISAVRYLRTNSPVRSHGHPTWPLRPGLTPRSRRDRDVAQACRASRVARGHAHPVARDGPSVAARDGRTGRSWSRFRKKAKEVGITPAARRDVVPLERRKHRTLAG